MSQACSKINNRQNELYPQNQTSKQKYLTAVVKEAINSINVNLVLDPFKVFGVKNFLLSAIFCLFIM